MRSLLRAATFAAAALLAIAPVRQAAAQVVTSEPSPLCASGSCDYVRFALHADTGPLELRSFRLAFDADLAQFFNAGHAVSYLARDDWGDFGGFGTVSADGGSLFIDFVDTGDPMFPGLPFSLAVGSTGFLDLEVSDLAGIGAEWFNFAWEAELEGGGTVRGVGRGVAVTTTPEPATLALTALGGVALAGVARRRRLVRR